MRNIFDQYSQHENRLTHALVCCLAEDKKLLRDFIRWITGEIVNIKNIEIVEQRLPGELELTEEESERRGLPDVWIHDHERWALIIENKVSSPLKNDQLHRHRQTAVKRGFEDITILAIVATEPKHRLPDGAVFRKWSDVYSWLYRQSSYSAWASRALRYMEIIESKWPDDGYLKEGTLTKFSGIPFSNENPYNYQEAKRILRLAIDELKNNRKLIKELDIDPMLPGRGAITGKEAAGVWDCLRLRKSRIDQNFTRFPHFTLSIRRDDVYALVTIPNGIQTGFRKRLFIGGVDGFISVFEKINGNFSVIVRKNKGAVPWIEIAQRRYKTQRSQPVIDARLNFDLRSAFAGSKSPKHQPIWIRAAYDSMNKRRANTQLAVGIRFLYTDCKELNSPRIVDAIADSWIACKPLIDSTVG